ncbi:DEAD/DEAH box helicase [Pseudoxanthobacter sp.]|uniref:DEAD/DEAH box helicase n=1 Tax=Pseudoxanthobacter sp. TaxID=1925742 RepID=UPI002FE2BFE4
MSDPVFEQQPPSSGLSAALSAVGRSAASAVTSWARIRSAGLNTLLLDRLSAAPGERDSFLADPVFEIARRWRAADQTLSDLSGSLLSPDLVAALERATTYAMRRDLRPYAHQLAAWRESLQEQRSVLVTSGTGSGKTECFLIPILNDLLTLKSPARRGVRAILLYPLNALIESQRERLAAWASGLGGKVRFALYNGDTPETLRSVRREPGSGLDGIEVADRRSIRENPPEILVTNVTMLEYLLLRAGDAPILDVSQEALRWIVLDEAHGYIGAQAAEMTLLLRRVRSAFGVRPDGVRLMATSATIGDGGAVTQLRAFLSALAGTPEDRVSVITGQTVDPEMPAPGTDRPIDPAHWQHLTSGERFEQMAAHPRIQSLRRRMGEHAVSLGDVSAVLFGERTRRADAQAVLDAGATACRGDDRLLPWRTHLFHRPLGGIWACIDPDCPERQPDLTAAGADWPFGAVHLAQRDHCGCTAPAFEVLACAECGTPFLAAGVRYGALPRLMPLMQAPEDDFAVDAEPNDDDDADKTIAGDIQPVWLGPGSAAHCVHIDIASGDIFDNVPSSRRSARLQLIEARTERTCCAAAARAWLRPLRFGPPFFMSGAAPRLIEALAPHAQAQGLPMGGRRALSFTDSRQGVARLAAKMQQDAERTLTRAFLWHAVQQRPRGADPAAIAELEQRIAALRKAGDSLRDVLADYEKQHAELTGDGNAVVRWPDLVAGFATQRDLTGFASAVWIGRAIGGREIEDDPRNLAEMFLLRELLRRPRVQNNPETMGLLRLAFPDLERAAPLRIPPALSAAGIDGDGYTGLALAAIDSEFRSPLAMDVPEWMVPIVAPRSGRLRSVFAAGSDRSGMDSNDRQWPGPVPFGQQRQLVGLVAGLLKADASDRQDQDRIGEVLEALWQLITSHAARNVGRGGWRLDRARMAVLPVTTAFLCPVTRRLFGTSVAGRTPHDIAQPMTRIALPRLPQANAGGLGPGEQAETARWLETDPQVGALRRQGLWTNLHDRLAIYPPFLRAQEHSAQIERPVLKHYEDDFSAGKINLLNCSTTMEMGIDIPLVSLVFNSNVPPSVSNYRQRVGRAGRRGERWAFGLTFCRDLPLDLLAFRAPVTFLNRPTAAPKVVLDSPLQVGRHVNAALLGTWLRARSRGVSVRSSIGFFFGLDQETGKEVAATPLADAFIADLRGDWMNGDDIATRLKDLLTGTVLETQPAEALAASSADRLERLMQHWRNEHDAIMAECEAMREHEARTALTLRGKRFRGEFMLAELARRGFTPAYGFPTDVVGFEHLSGRRRDSDGDARSSWGDRQGGASRPLTVALREYAPGNEVVIDGLVHLSEGISLAWSANADTSRLENLKGLWTCRACHGSGLTSQDLPACPDCGSQDLQKEKVLKPTGFRGARSPHTGYESLSYVAAPPAHISARQAAWVALPDTGAGRFRADPAGEVITTATGRLGGGYAVCLDCGRTMDMAPPVPGTAAVPPPEMIRHKPLIRVGLPLRDGKCRGGYTAAHRVQTNILLAQDTRTDVFELQTVAGAPAAAVLAAAAGLREALADHLGLDAGELGIAAATSAGPSGETRPSAFVFDRAAGGAGLSSRLGEGDFLAAMLRGAEKKLDCPDQCLTGCPACILRPDINGRDQSLDRPGGLELVRMTADSLQLPAALQIFGADTRLLGRDIAGWLDQMRRQGHLTSLDVPLIGPPDSWDLEGWPLASALPRLKEAGLAVRLHLPPGSITHAAFTLPVKLALHRLAAFATIAVSRPPATQNGMQVVAYAGTDAGMRALATASDAEAVIGPSWGMASAAPVVIGPASAPASGPAYPSSDIIGLDHGGAHLLRLGTETGGPLAGFGNRFWQSLQRQAGIKIVTLSEIGVKEVHYCDRYLVTPLHVALLAEVLLAMPGGKNARRIIEIAAADRPGQPPCYISHNFPDDARRTDLLRALLPDAGVQMERRKTDLPHYRRLVITLKDDRRLEIFIDQGMGAWRTLRPARYPFEAGVEEQVRSVRSADLILTLHDENGSPATLTLSPP